MGGWWKAGGRLVEGRWEAGGRPARVWLEAVERLVPTSYQLYVRWIFDQGMKIFSVCH